MVGYSLLLLGLLPEFHLYLGPDAESEVVRTALTSRTSDTPTSAHRTLMARHRALVQEIARYSLVIVHETQKYEHPRYSFSRWEEPVRFGWYEYRGRQVKAWCDTIGVLKHIRYLCQIRHISLQEERPRYSQYRHYQVGSMFDDSFSLLYSSHGPREGLDVWPPRFQHARKRVALRVGPMKVDVTFSDPASSSIPQMEEDLDMGTGIITD